MNHIDDKFFIALADNLLTLIEKKGLDVAEIAAAANIDRRQVYRLINKEHMPKLSTLIKISLAAGIEPNILFDFKFNYKEYMEIMGIYLAKPKK
ncbi:helix-turn-helix domain-containing protein [Flavobacterium macacae]|uniref:XRE family transcriptional regulator n=1 Tax=Flavobacterium macacae TaxID=2488993 RepID=A0A3P3W043_9FLAO|nr:helix-turn-helix transcriptional regulator [Flavobacterium macacae]RRJ88431.1 XRE family transcriptional regulator [Flavobacterium macacae]